MKHSITHHNVPRETFKIARQLIEQNKTQLGLYIDHLLWWNTRINLVSRDVSRETIKKHVYHSLILSSFKPFKKASLIADAGSGGGLPGLPLAICYPGKRFIINDIVSKKIMAVKQIARKIGLSNVRFYDESIENLTIDKEFLLISKHAFKVDDLFNMTKNKSWTRQMFYKGLSLENEIKHIEEPLSISVWDLSSESDDRFFQGKAIVIINRK